MSPYRGMKSDTIYVYTILMKEKKMRNYLLSLALITLVGCSPDLDEAKRFPHNDLTWEWINTRANEGRGGSELEKKNDKETATKQIDAIKNKIFYTIRTVYDSDPWKNEAERRKSWAKIESGFLPNWQPDILLLGEPKAGNYLPWLISNYDYATESFRIIPAPFDCFCDDNKCTETVSYLRCFGDPPPTAVYDVGTSYQPSNASSNGWAWFNDDLMHLKMNEQDAGKFVNSFKRHTFQIKVFYKYFNSAENAVIVKIIGFTFSDDKSKKILFETGYQDSKMDGKTYRAGKGLDWRYFTR